MAPFILAALLATPLLALTQDDLFDECIVQAINLEMKPEDWATLRENYLLNTFYPVVMHWRDQSVSAGIRSRGNTSRNATKPGLRIDFNRYDKSALFLGLASLALDNGVQDPSLLRERLAMGTFRRMGIPAPRAVHALIFVNSELLGLYILMDRLDTYFLTWNYGNNAGDLYEFNRTGEYRFEYLGEDPALYAEMFDAKNSNADRQALVSFIRDVNEASDEDFAGIAARHLDIERFARYLAVENFISEIDGVAGEFGMNNFYLYRRPDTLLFEFIPWDKDFAFNGSDHPLDYNVDRSVLTRRLMTIPDFRDVYYRTLREAAEGSGAWLESEAWRIYGQIQFAAWAEPSPTCGEEGGECFGPTWEYEAGSVLDYTRERSAWVLASLP